MSKTWTEILGDEKEKSYFKEILALLDSSNQRIYPPKNMIFNALKHTSFESVKVVILGQDPYHGPNEAHGLSFSVPKGIKIPPSLMNIYKELHSDLNIPPACHGNLESWANQGVLLLNTSLSVKHKQPGSHSRIGWQTFTDHIIESISQEKTFVVFMLWGKHAQSKKPLIKNNHLILESTHPSPFSAHRGFLGSKPFSKTNSALESNQLSAIDWALPT